MTPIELWLPIGAAAFYLYDSTCLLWQNELLFIRAGSRWQVNGGMELRLMGRRVCLPNPLQPQRLSFLVRWSRGDTRVDGTTGETIAQLHSALLPVRVLVMAMTFVLLFALPVVSWSLGAGLVMLLLFAAYYLMVLVALAAIWRVRRTVDLAGRSFALLCFDVLACAPFAANLVRKLARRHGIAGDPLQFAERNFDNAARAQLDAIVSTRLAEESAGNKS